MRRTAGMLYDELIATGVARGEARGEVRGRILALLDIGSGLFGAPPDSVREQLQGLSVEQLSTIARRLARSSSWDEALG